MIIKLVYALAVVNSLVMSEEIEKYNLRDQQQEYNRLREQQIKMFNLSRNGAEHNDRKTEQQERENKLREEQLERVRKLEEDKLRQQEINKVYRRQRVMNNAEQQGVCSLKQTLPNWNCEFDTHGCGIYNQPNMPSFFGLVRYDSESVEGKRGVLLVDTLNELSCGARLITPYFPTNDCHHACLTIEYIMVGQSPNVFYIIQQDRDNYCLFQHKHYHAQSWRNASVTVELASGRPRFFIETRFNYHVFGSGFVALANINFEYGACAVDDRNSCDLNPHISIHRN